MNWISPTRHRDLQKGRFAVFSAEEEAAIKGTQEAREFSSISLTRMGQGKGSDK